MKSKPSVLEEAITIFESGEAERRRVAKTMQKPENSNNLGIISGKSVIESYELLQEMFSDPSTKQPFDRMLNELKTVFLNDSEEVEGSNINENIGTMAKFLVSQANILREKGLHHNKEHRIDQLYNQYVDPSSSVNPVSSMKKWMLPKQPPPTSDIAPLTFESTPASATSPCPGDVTLAIPCQNSLQVAVQKFQPRKAKSTDPLGESITPRSGKKKGLRGLLELRPQRMSESDPDGFETFFKSFAQLDSIIWSEIREVARDETIPPEGCGQRLVDIVIRDKDSPWRVFYQQIHNAKTMCSEFKETVTKLEETTKEVNSLRETNILNQAFLTGDMAQSLMDEITDLRNEEIKQRLLLSDAVSALEKSSQERDEYVAESRRICQHLAEAQSLLKRLQLISADVYSTIPEENNVEAALLMERIDRVHLSLEPDSGAPSGKRCPSCLQVCSLTPFCPATGRVHNEGAEYSPTPSSPKQVSKTPGRPPIMKTKSNLARRKFGLASPASKPTLLIVLSAAVVVLSSTGICPCGMNLVVKQPPAPPAPEAPVAIQIKPPEPPSNPKSHKQKSPAKTGKRPRRTSKQLLLERKESIFPDIESKVPSNVRVKKEDEFSAQEFRTFIEKFDKMYLYATKLSATRLEMISLCQSMLESDATESIAAICGTLISVFDHMRSLDWEPQKSLERNYSKIEFDSMLEVTQEMEPVAAETGTEADEPLDENLLLPGPDFTKPF
eukprot:TRINITY_DN3149_c0_g4_i1.p1 TRINITY_DN3149_c0_g4~~TRINITY_DN3149_c0_g4_i1.p1  ORF type:complete len:727 (+),score=120.61 TRINITY_DN3149_c0_g4_i1:82-2262(+)